MLLNNLGPPFLNGLANQLISPAVKEKVTASCRMACISAKRSNLAYMNKSCLHEQAATIIYHCIRLNGR